MTEITLEATPAVKPGTGSNIDYRILFQSTPGLYLVLTADLHIAALTRAYAQATLIDADAVIGRHIFDVFPDNPDDPKADGVRNLHASLQRVLDLRLPDTMAVQRYDIRLPDGSFSERYWSPVNTPILADNGEVSWIIHRAENVTELMRMNAARAEGDQLVREQERVIGEMRTLNAMLAMTLKENRKLEAERLYLADLVASSNDAIIARTPDGVVASWNKAAERMYGYRADEVIGKPVASLAPLLQARDADQIAERLNAGEEVTQYETVRRRRDGTEFAVSITASLVRNPAGEITGSAAIVRDITERRQAEERMRSLQAELVHLSRWNTMGMMASTFAHELNQPLTATTNYARAAARTLKGLNDPVALRATELIDKAVEEIKLAGGIIRSLRDFIDKRGAGQRAENINAVVEEAISLSLLGTGRNMATRIELDPALPPVMVDKIQIEQVLLNLIRNALEAMEGLPDGQLMIATGRDEPGFLGVSVSDTGTGLDPEIADRLFQPFLTTKEKGMGIGLTICQSIIEAHGGKIWASPVSPHGVCFRFRLPFAGSAEP